MENYGRMRKNAPKESNSMDKFVREIKSDGDFLRAQDMFAPNTSLSKLSLKRPPQKLAPIFNKENYGKRKSNPIHDNKSVAPLPTKLLPIKETVESTKSKVESKPKRGREMVVITGGVPFVLKTFKLYPDMRAMYEVYGNIVRMHKGKIRYEHIILLRSERGPVMQGFHFDFANLLETFHVGNSIRCIGEFTEHDRFRIHKIQQVSTPPSEAVLSRIQNVSAFSLSQSMSPK